MPVTDRFALAGYFVIVALFLTASVAMSRAVPLFEQSDETEHLLYAHHILETGTLPVIQSREQMAARTDPVEQWNNQSHHAPLYYLIAALIAAPTDRDDLRTYLRPNPLVFVRGVTEQNHHKWLHPVTDPGGDTAQLVYTLRAFSALLGAGTLFLIVQCGLILHRSTTFALLTAGSVAVLPTFIVVHSAISNDPLLIFLYSAGVLWCLRHLPGETNEPHAISWADAALIGFILAGATLTKLTGLSLTGVVGLTLLWGWHAGSIRRGDVARVVSMCIAVTVMLAGWWYARNLSLYGDPLAQAATASLWGREVPLTLAVLGQDLLRIGQTFVLMIGYLHNPVVAPLGFVTYAGIVALVGIVGSVYGLRASRFTRAQRIRLAWSFMVFSLVLATVLIGTIRIDISYGRLLFPAIAPLALLLTAGWRVILRDGAYLLPVPLIAITVFALMQWVPRAYPRLEAVEAVAADATDVGWNNEGIIIEAVHILDERINRAESVTVDLYLRGEHSSNASLWITVVDTERIERLGHIEIYPGIAASDQLGEQRWRYQARVPTASDIAPRPPRVLGLMIQWVDPVSATAYPYANGETRLELSGPVWIDQRYQPQALPIPAQAVFGEQIYLHSAAVPGTALPGDTIALAFLWEALSLIPQDWTLTVQLFNEEGKLAAQIDGTPYWYPTGRWIAGERFEMQRNLVIPADLTAGRYTLHVGWYQQQADGTFQRLPLQRGAGSANLFMIPRSIAIE